MKPAGYGYVFAMGMQKAMASGRIEQICHPLIEETVRLLDQMFAEDKR